MTIYEAMQKRHAVRSYTDAKIAEPAISTLIEEIKKCNEEGSMNIQLITNEKKAFSGFMTTYGRFRGVSDYIALVGPKSEELDQKAGYYGERLVLLAQQLSLNTCWVSTNYNKKKCCAAIEKGEGLVCVIAVGYGTSQGKPHKSKPMEALCKVDGEMPDWFKKGVNAAMLAPTALNKQNFTISLDGDMVKADTANSSYGKVDLGIVKYHFEIGSGKNGLIWK